MTMPTFCLPVRRVGFAFGFLLLVCASIGAREAIGMQQPAAPQSLKPYWHVFAAYAVVIIIVGGWALSIARRLRDVERRLVD